MKCIFFGPINNVMNLLFLKHVIDFDDKVAYGSWLFISFIEFISWIGAYVTLLFKWDLILIFLLIL